MLQSKQVDGLIVRRPRRTAVIVACSEPRSRLLLLLRYFSRSPHRLRDGGQRGGRPLDDRPSVAARSSPDRARGGPTHMSSSARAAWTATVRRLRRPVLPHVRAWYARQPLRWRAATKRLSNCSTDLSGRPPFSPPRTCRLWVCLRPPRSRAGGPQRSRRRRRRRHRAGRIPGSPPHQLPPTVEEIGVQVVAILMSRIGGDRNGFKQVVAQAGAHREKIFGMSRRASHILRDLAANRGPCIRWVNCRYGGHAWDLTAGTLRGARPTANHSSSRRFIHDRTDRMSNPPPTLRMLSDEQIRTIHNTSLDILSGTGIEMRHQALEPCYWTPARGSRAIASRSLNT